MKEGALRHSIKRAPAIKVSWLESFIVTADLGSFTDAAEALGVSQSSISRHVIDLESALSRPLRFGEGPFTLSPQGEAFLPLARKIVDELSEFRASGLYRD